MHLAGRQEMQTGSLDVVGMKVYFVKALPFFDKQDLIIGMPVRSVGREGGNRERNGRRRDRSILLNFSAVLKPENL